MNSELSLTISRSNIVDQVASFLYATGKVPHSKEIEDIEFSFMNLTEVPIKVTLKEVHKPN